MAQIGFDIVIDIGSTTSNFLDISLNLTLNNYCPFTKPNAKIIYINNGSDHPKIIRKNIPIMIESRLCKLSKNKELYKRNKQKSTEKNNFNHKLE